MENREVVPRECPERSDGGLMHLDLKEPFDLIGPLIFHPDSLINVLNIKAPNLRRHPPAAERAKAKDLVYLPAML